jgi:hypothetical protein
MRALTQELGEFELAVGDERAAGREPGAEVTAHARAHARLQQFPRDFGYVASARR